MPQYFRFLTLLAFKIFLEEKVDVAVIETGVGGRTDATNILETPVACGITPIGYDHMNVLGSTLTEIAFEKSGIFKHGVPAFTTTQTEEAMKELERRAPLLIGEGHKVHFVKPLGNEVTLGLQGEHQKMNAAVAVALSKILLQKTNKSKETESLDEIISMKNLSDNFLRGLEKCEWPGRGQKISLEGHSITLHLDGAHTPESMEACKSWFFDQKTTSRDSLKILVFNCNTSREPATLLKNMVRCQFDLVLFTSNETGKSHILEDKRPNKEKQTASLNWQHKVHDIWISLSGTENCKIVGSIPETLEQLYQFEKENPHKKIEVLSTGSLYLVGAWLELLKPEMCDTI